MKKFSIVLGLTIFALMGSPTLALAESPSVKKGQKIFKKKFRKKCRFSGVRFARHHTQNEWENIYDDGEFEKEAKRICPRLDLKKIKSSWWKNVYEFSYMYASDGKVPKC